MVISGLVALIVRFSPSKDPTWVCYRFLNEQCPTAMLILTEEDSSFFPELIFFFALVKDLNGGLVVGLSFLKLEGVLSFGTL